MRPEAEERQDVGSRIFRSLTWIMGVILLVTVVGAVAYQNFSVAESVNPMIPDLISTLRDAGLNVGQAEPLPGKAGANWADTVSVEGQSLNIYRFAPEASKEQAKALAAATAAGKLDVDGVETSAKFQGPFAITGYEGNPREADLLSSFDNFGPY